MRATVGADADTTVPAPTNWGLIPKDIKVQVSVTAKTRGQPAHAGTAGPIRVRLLTPELKHIPFTMELQFTQLTAGTEKMESMVVLLNEPQVPGGIEVLSETSDAWLCEYIDVAIEGLGSNRFACQGWAVRPGGADDRQARRYTEGTLVGFETVHYPIPQVEMWERRFFPMSACSAQCQVEQGFNCYQFQGYTTRCFAKLCDVPINDTDGKVFYDLTHYNQNELYGHMCRTDLPIDIQLPADKGYVCYKWSGEIYQDRLCPYQQSNMLDALKPFRFPPTGTDIKVDRSAFFMVDDGSGKDCLPSSYLSAGWDPPKGNDGYLSAAECSMACQQDINCDGSKFHIRGPYPGGSACREGLTSIECMSRCELFSGCNVTINTSAAILVPGIPDMFHVSRKVKRTTAELGGEIGRAHV